MAARLAALGTTLVPQYGVGGYRLRKEHLERLGWRVHRLWSTSWFSDPEAELVKLQAAYTEAVRANPPAPPPPPDDPVQAPADLEPSADDDTAAGAVPVPDRAAVTPPSPGAPPTRASAPLASGASPSRNGSPAPDTRRADRAARRPSRSRPRAADVRRITVPAPAGQLPSLTPVSCRA